MFTYAAARDPQVAGVAVVTDRFLGVCGPAMDDSAALRLWQAMTAAGANLATVQHAFDAEYPDAAPDAALVELVDAGRRAVSTAIRGDARILVRGDAHPRAAADGTGWTVGRDDGVTGMRLFWGPADTDDTPLLPLRRGLVRAAALHWGSKVRVPARPDPAAPENEPPLDTVQFSRADLDALPPRPATPARPPLPLPRGTRAVLQVGADRTVELDRPVVLGRSPRPAHHPGAQLVSVTSPHREISGTHLEVRLDGDVIVARDLDSTNGTIVHQPTGETQLLRHGTSVTLPAGSTLDLGDGTVAVFDLVDGPVA